MSLKQQFNIPYTTSTEYTKMGIEFKRVIMRGCLHLVGFNDSTEKEIEQMRCKEEEYLNNFPKDIIL